MKRCPQCNQTYPDDLNFCLSDGGQLSFVSDSSSEEPTVFRPSPFVQPPLPTTKQGVSPIFAYLAIGLLALVVGGAAVMWIKSDSNSNSNSNALTTAKNETPINSSTPVEQKVTTSNNPKEVKKNENSSAPTMRPSQPTSGTWFVVLGSYPKSEAEKANQRLRYVQGLGYDATLVDTNNYPGFKGGLYSVVVGPYSKADAKSLLGRMKSSVSDAYIKSGW